MSEFNDSTVRVDHSAEVTVKVTAPNAPINRLTVRRVRDNSLDERALRSAVGIFAAAAAELDRALTAASIRKDDCIEIITTSGTTIRVNCPTITLGEPTIE